MNNTVCRYAPSPSGLLHLGNIATSLLTWLDCKSLGGKLIFRLEDLDRDRCKPEFSKKLAEDLLWLGIPWDIGWSEISPEYAQSCRTERYDEAFELLRRKSIVYPCYCSRSQRIAASAPHFGEVYAERGCHCSSLSAGEIRVLEASGRKPSWKVRVPDREMRFIDGHYGEITSNLKADGDYIIKRSDGLFAYQLAVSVDDMEMGINRVVRGSDLLGSTARQLWLIEELGGDAPEYCHAPLLMADDMRKLSKRYGSLSTEALQEKYTPEEIIGKLAFMLGISDSDKEISPTELISKFSWDKVPAENINFKSSEW